jgi:hypothetical protein
MPSSSDAQSTSFSRSVNLTHSMFSRSPIAVRLREAARTLWPAAASAELTAEPIKPEEPVTSIRNDILKPDQI